MKARESWRSKQTVLLKVSRIVLKGIMVYSNPIESLLGMKLNKQDIYNNNGKANCCVGMYVIALKPAGITSTWHTWIVKG